MSSSIANTFIGVKDFIRDLTSSKPPVHSRSKSHESLKSSPQAQMSPSARGASRGALSPQTITVEDDVEEDEEGEYDAAPTSTNLMATRLGKTTSRRIASSKPERHASSNPLNSSIYNLEGTLMEMFEPSESERPKPEDLEEDIARLLGGTSQQDKGATAIAVPTNNPPRLKQSSYGGYRGGRNNLNQTGPRYPAHSSPLGVSADKMYAKSSGRPLQTRTSRGSNVAQSKLGWDNHTEGPPTKKQRTAPARQSPIEILDDLPSSTVTVKRVNKMAQTNSTTNNHNSQPSHSRRAPPQLSEYRDTEGMVDPSLRGRGGANRSTQAAGNSTESLIYLSSSNETLNPMSTVGVVRKNRLQSQSANQKASPYFPNPGHFTNGDQRRESSQARLNMNEDDGNLRHRFVSTDGKRRDSTTQQDSEDELNGPATIPTRIREPSTSNVNEDVEMLDNPAPVAEIAPSNIKRTNFSTSPKKTSPSEPPRKRAKRVSDHEYAINYLRFEECQVEAEQEAFIAINRSKKVLEFFVAKGAFDDSVLEFQIGSIQAIDCGNDSSKKLRLKVRKGAGSGTVRIQFESHKRATDFIKSLQSVIPEVKVNDRASEYMDKAFEKDEATANTYPAKKGSAPTEMTKSRHSIPSANESRPRTRLVDGMGGEGGRVSDRPTRATPNQTVITGRDRAGLEHDLQDTPDFSELIARSGLPYTSTRKTRSASKKEDPLSSRMASLKQPTIDLGPRWKKALVFPKDSKKSIHVEFSDMERLREHEFLNDNLIEFHIRYLQHYLEQDRPEIASKIYFFNTFFYERLTKDKKGGAVNFNAVAKWTNKVDLFGYDFVVVPINENAHWYLAIICNLRGLERKIASPESAGSESEGEVAEKDEDTKERNPRSMEPHGADERLPLNLGADAEESNEDARESFASLHLGEHGGYSLTKGIKSDDEEKDWPSEGENGGGHAKVIPKSAKEGTPAKDTAAKSSPTKSSKASSTGKKGRKTKRKSLGPKYNPDIPAIITLDSLISQRGATIKALKEYLREEAKAKRQMKVEDKDLQGINAKGIPTQQNFSDCGLFLLAYLEIFLKDPKEFVAKIMKREMSETEWPPTTGYDLRERLRKMIQRLYDEQQDKKLPNKEEDKIKRDTCEEGFTLLGLKKESSPEVTDINLSPEHDNHPSYEPTPAKKMNKFEATLNRRFHTKESLDPISLEADGQSPKLVNKTKIQVRDSQDEAPKSTEPPDTLAQQLAEAAKTAVGSGDEVEEVQHESRSSSRTRRGNSVDTNFVRDPNRSYELALQSKEARNNEVVDLDKSPVQKSDVRA